MRQTIDHHHEVIASDVNNIQPRLAAIHVLIDAEWAAIIDTGVNSPMPALLSTLQQYQLQAEQVAYITFTQNHLDHAARGTGEACIDLERQHPVPAEDTLPRRDHPCDI